MELNTIKKILEPQFGYLAKSTGEQLWAHHFAVWSIFVKMSKYYPSLDYKEKYLLELSCLFHDIGKEKSENQDILLGEKSGKVIHKPKIEDLSEHIDAIKDFLPNPLSQEDKKFIFDIILTHHSVSDSDIENITTSSAGIFTEILRYSDWLASFDNISPNTLLKIKNYTDKLFDLVYIEISRLASPTTNLILDITIKKYIELGWTVLMVFDTGAIFIGNKGTGYPEKALLIEDIYSNFVKKSLEFQKPNPTNFTNVMLAGASKTKPSLFLDAHKDIILEALGNVDKASSFFFKFVIEVFDNAGYISGDVREKYPVFDVLKAASGTRGVPNARKKWSEIKGGTIPDKLNDMLKEMFYMSKIKDVIPNEFSTDEVLKNTELNKLKPDVLLDILYTVARKFEITDAEEDKQLKEYLSYIISLEEEINFSTLALRIFERYKKYKTDYNAENGVCERCSCPVTIGAKKSLGFIDRYGFSQVRTRPDGDRATCHFCAYDVMYLRRDIRESDSKIYLRIDSKIPDLFNLYPPLKKFIAGIKQGIEYPYSIVNLQDREEFNNIPFAKKVRIPLPNNIKDDQTSDPIKNERGLLFEIGRTGVNYSPKDLKSKYEPLYHVTNLLGFQTSIGTEEQNGLFGKKIITIEGDYYKSLAVIILANFTGKKDKKFIFSSELLEKSPSVAITFVGSAVEGGKIKKDQVYRFFDFIYKSKIKLFETERGVYTMKDLLKHAAFFSEGIPKFCWTGEDWSKWISSSSKHLISKPVSKAMNDILQGKDFDDAFARYLSHIRDNIAKEKSEDKEGAKTDVNELAEFVNESKSILMLYAQLKKDNITEFIRAKNALMSAIYVFKRYENLPEVVNK
ncbi:MAG: hypothetical protein PHH85_11655 [Candidatus Methanoperedens sp.]|nr:hypothetical protein [Candidatus Methanoperedens sp.]